MYVFVLASADELVGQPDRTDASLSEKSKSNTFTAHICVTERDSNRMMVTSHRVLVKKFLFCICIYFLFILIVFIIIVLSRGTQTKREAYIDILDYRKRLVKMVQNTPQD